MSSLFIFVFSVLILHTGATTLSGAYVPVSRGNPLPTRGDNDPLYLRAKRTLLGFINKASQASPYSALNSDKSLPACSGNCNRNPYSATYCDGNCKSNPYSVASSADNKPVSDPLNLEEKQALLSFINKVLLPNSSSLNWTDSEYACSWKGVTCNPSGITVLYLRLPLKNLTGEIPPNTIGKLTSLRVLSLGRNRLSGQIPSDFSNLNFLTTLYLNRNFFSGNIPSFFSTLSYLTILRLDNNSFSGNLPDMIKAQDLSTFDVSYNKLDGPIPRSLSGFPEDAFSNNSNLCGPPLSPCNASYSPPDQSDGEGDNTSTPKRRAIFGIFSGSTMMLLIFLGSVGKNMYEYIRPFQNKRLVTFGDDAFDLKDLLKTTVEVLGGGSVGTSYKQVLVGKNKTVVLKILKDVVVTKEEFKAKMDVLGKIKNRYVVPLRAFYYSNEEKWLVYDYMPAGSLSARLHGVHKSSKSKNGRTPLANLSVNDLVHENPNINVQEKGSALDSHHSPSPVLVAAPMEAGDTPANPIGVSGSPNSFDDAVKAINQGSVLTQFNWDRRVQIALSAAKRLAYLHVVEKIVHGNITSSNIFFQQETNNEVSLSDYGLNTLFHGSRSSLNHRVTGYWAPEVLETREFTFESDVYSFGVLLLELLTHQIPDHASLDKEGVHFSDWVDSIVCEEPKVELFDVELTRDHKTDKMVQLLRIAKDCVLIVPNQRPPMCSVVSMMEDMLSRQSSDYNSKGYNDRPSLMELVIL